MPASITDTDLQALWNDEGMSMSDIARARGISRNAVAGIINRARARGVELRARPQTPNPRSKRSTARRNRAARVQRTRVANAKLTAQRAVRARRGELFEPEMLTSMLDLSAEQCRWPIGDAHVKIMFCGLDREHGSSYCEMHRAQALKPAKG